MSFFSPSKNNMDSALQEVELGPDLEWLLLNDQAGPHALAVGLNSEFGSELWEVLHVFFPGSEEARQAVAQALGNAVAASASYRAGTSVRAWFYQHAFDPPIRGGLPEIAGQANALQQLSWSERLALVLSRHSGWGEERTSALLGIDRTELQERCRSAWEQSSKQGMAVRMHAALALITAPSEGSPVPVLSQPEVDALAAAAVPQAEQLLHRSQLTRHLREAALAALLVLILAAFFNVADRLEPEIEKVAALTAVARPTTRPPVPTNPPILLLQYASQPGDTIGKISYLFSIEAGRLAQINYMDSRTELKSGQVIELPFNLMDIPPPLTTSQSFSVSPVLSSDASPADLLAFWQDDFHWQTAWLDIEHIYYGPPGYIGPPLYLRTQVLAQQPGQVLEVSQLAGERQPQVRLLSGKLEYQFVQETNTAFVRPTDTEVLLGYPGALLAPGLLLGLSDTSNFEVTAAAHYYGRESLAFEWFPPHRPGYRFQGWIDRQTGLVMGARLFGGPGYQTLVSDSRTVNSSFDFPLSPDRLHPLTARSQGFAFDAGGNPEPAPIGQLRFNYLGNFTQAAGHARLEPQSLPPGFEPASQPLAFQYPVSPMALDAVPENIPGPIELFAGGYFLAEIPAFPDPWLVQCARSPDGSHLAWAGPLVSSQPEANVQYTFGWIDLNHPDQVHQPTYSEDTTLVFLGKTGLDFDLGGLRRSILPGISYRYTSLDSFNALDYAESLVWSLDNRYLALLAPGETWQGKQLVVLDIATDQVKLIDPVSDGSQPVDWITKNWRVSFPQETRGLAGCAQPPAYPAGSVK